jgi:rRNA maturation RNase YbeY
MPVYFHNEGVSLVFKNKRAVSSWLSTVIKSFKKEVGTLNFIFCTDEYLLTINKSYLNHNHYTDIITFDYCVENKVSGDLFISIERVKEYSLKNNIEFNNEIHRVIVHGVLHLCGLNDKTEREKEKMREQENKFLALFFS